MSFSSRSDRIGSPSRTQNNNTDADADADGHAIAFGHRGTINTMGRDGPGKEGRVREKQHGLIYG